MSPPDPHTAPGPGSASATNGRGAAFFANPASGLCQALTRGALSPAGVSDGASPSAGLRPRLRAEVFGRRRAVGSGRQDRMASLVTAFRRRAPGRFRAPCINAPTHGRSRGETT